MQQSKGQTVQSQIAKARKEMVIKQLREHGFRITKQRRVILDVILEQNCSNCKEMYYKAHTVDPSIGKATVYRMVNVLEEIGLFSRDDLYKLSVKVKEEDELPCIIELENHTQYSLSEKELKKVICEGMKACGYSEKDVLHVKLKVPKNKKRKNK